MHEILTPRKSLNAEKMNIFLSLELSDVAFSLLINVKMPTIVDILTFMSSVELRMKTSFITLRSN